MKKTETKIRAKVTKRASPDGVRVMQFIAGREYVVETAKIPDLLHADEFEVVETKKGKG